MTMIEEVSHKSSMVLGSGRLGFKCQFSHGWALWPAPQFPHLKIGDNNPNLTGFPWSRMRWLALHLAKHLADYTLSIHSSQSHSDTSFKWYFVQVLCLAPGIWTSLSSKLYREDGHLKSNCMCNGRLKDRCRGYENIEVRGAWEPSLHKCKFLPCSIEHLLTITIILHICRV